MPFGKGKNRPFYVYCADISTLRGTFRRFLNFVFENSNHLKSDVFCRAFLIAKFVLNAIMLIFSYGEIREGEITERIFRPRVEAPTGVSTFLGCLQVKYSKKRRKNLAFHIFFVTLITKN